MIKYSNTRNRITRFSVRTNYQALGHVETMNSDELVEGKLYFLCGYENSRYPFPQIESYIYVGKNENQFEFHSAGDDVGLAIAKENDCGPDLEGFFSIHPV